MSSLNRILLLLAIYFAAGALAANCKAAESGGTNVDGCAVGKCELIGEVEVCTECRNAGNVPINEKCIAQNAATVTAAGCKKQGGGDPTDSVKCEQCDGAYFLHKGGCYSKNAAPGSTICTAASAGVCSAAASECFIPPGATKTDQSIMACNDAAEITLTNTKKYV